MDVAPSPPRKDSSSTQSSWSPEDGVLRVGAREGGRIMGDSLKPQCQILYIGGLLHISIFMYENFLKWLRGN